jgi:hypothetical protein
MRARGALKSTYRGQLLLTLLSLILPNVYFRDPSQPLSENKYKELQRRHPLHPDSENYRSIVGDRISANGYPISSWRWMSVCSEWSEILVGALWKDLDVAGYRP